MTGVQTCALPIFLVDQAFAKDPKTTVGKVVEATGGELTGFVRFRVGA